MLVPFGEKYSGFHWASSCKQTALAGKFRGDLSAPAASALSDAARRARGSRRALMCLRMSSFPHLILFRVGTAAGTAAPIFLALVAGPLQGGLLGEQSMCVTIG
eukprot:CAMPEP_0204136248 /NCGR_PEP_ID=MMETSP0361-20130328/16721_1 /ASSEMBLY_ACC=CAM_ASM_000343 /TAXON_ID=268821 /ORGANISM="Scrippsiella Hangoei, Strain SHTV-5" /LENGTH=103 /DNA_ID=CAMNT_0051089735 /DNA_START=84 /DNA_END=395 /DNA_ORIENTATION=-